MIEMFIHCGVCSIVKKVGIEPSKKLAVNLKRNIIHQSSP